MSSLSIECTTDIAAASYVFGDGGSVDPLEGVVVVSSLQMLKLSVQFTLVAAMAADL